MTTPFQKIRFAEKVNGFDLNRVQDNVGTVFDDIQQAEGLIIPSETLAVGDNVIEHGLGRTLIGWMPVRVRAAATLYDKQDTNSTPDKTLIINASAAVTVDLWVF